MALALHVSGLGLGLLALALALALTPLVLVTSLVLKSKPNPDGLDEFLHLERAEPSSVYTQLCCAMSHHEGLEASTRKTKDNVAADSKIGTEIHVHVYSPRITIYAMCYTIKQSVTRR